MQRLARFLFPPQCLCCDEFVNVDQGLCPACWAETPFVSAHGCESCAEPLIGEVEKGDLCDSCRETPRPWKAGRAAFIYGDNARSLVLKFKHGDRTDLAPALGAWLAEAATPMIAPNMIVAPVPLHWKRGLQRQYNQALLLSQHVAKQLKLQHCPNLLQRHKATAQLDGMTAQERKDMVSGAITLRPKFESLIQGRPVLLIDDVMTTGATMTECANACLSGGAEHVYVSVLARVAKRD